MNSKRFPACVVLGGYRGLCLSARKLPRKIVLIMALWLHPMILFQTVADEEVSIVAVKMPSTVRALEVSGIETPIDHPALDLGTADLIPALLLYWLIATDLGQTSQTRYLNYPKNDSILLGNATTRRLLNEYETCHELLTYFTLWYLKSHHIRSNYSTQTTKISQRLRLFSFYSK